MKENIEKKTCNSESLAWVSSGDATEATYFSKDNAIAQQVLFLFSHSGKQSKVTRNQSDRGLAGTDMNTSVKTSSILLAEKIRVQILWNSGRCIKVASDLIVLTMKALFSVQQTTVNICGIKLMAVKRFPFTVGDVLQLAQSKTFPLDFFSGDISNC